MRVDELIDKLTTLKVNGEITGDSIVCVRDDYEFIHDLNDEPEVDEDGDVVLTEYYS